MGELGQLVDDSMVGDHREVLFVARNVGDGKADGRKHLFMAAIHYFLLIFKKLVNIYLLIFGLQKIANELETPDKRSDHVSRVLRIPDTRRQGPGSCSLVYYIIIINIMNVTRE